MPPVFLHKLSAVVSSKSRTMEYDYKKGHLPSSQGSQNRSSTIIEYIPCPKLHLERMCLFMYFGNYAMEISITLLLFFLYGTVFRKGLKPPIASQLLL